MLIASTVYYFINNEKLGRRSDIVGDGICDNFSDKAGQDSCCFEAHKNDIHIDCVGNWQYISGIRFCQYVCDNSLPICPADTQVCDNNMVVKRNASNNCEFDKCY